MNRFLVYISKKSKNLHSLLYVVTLLSFIVMACIVPYIFKSVVYPICYEKTEMTGKIENILISEATVAVKRKVVSMPQYHFVVDGRVMRVYPSHVREYEIGEKFTYYLYASEENEIADCNDYSIVQGIAGIVLVVFICYANIFIVWSGPRSIESEAVEEKKHITKNSYNKMSAKELYALCQEREIYVLKGKEKNKEFLKRCLRSEDSSERWLKTEREKQFPLLVFFLIIKLAALGFVAYSIIKTVYYLIYLIL